MKRSILTTTAIALSLAAASPSFAFGVEREMKESGEKGGTSFAVERKMKESGEKGGTADINIGVGELQEATSAKPATKSKKGGNVETTWKVEEGES